MITDRPPRKASRITEYLASDQLTNLDLPPNGDLQAAAKAIESVIKDGTPVAVRRACLEFLGIAANFYRVPNVEVRVLSARPLRAREGGWASELFADYTPKAMLIRIWTRTAVRKQVTSYGTFLSTLCHEFCHHLDCQRLGFRNSPHTRGFYQRTAVLYHYARDTPIKRLVWMKIPNGRWRIDWQQMNRSR